MRRFYETLRGLGDAEGGNLVVERYSAEGRADRIAAVAAAVVSRNPDVIVTNLNDLVSAFAAATTTIPIVAITGYPVPGGLVTSLARPGGNLTGVSVDAGIGIGAKRLQILKEAIPSATKVAYLVSARGRAARESAIRDAAHRLGIALIANILRGDEVKIRRAFARWRCSNSMPPL